MMLKDCWKGINGDVLIYGAHLVAMECCRFLISNGKGENIIGFAVTKKEENPTELEGFPVREIDEYIARSESCTIIIAMPEKYHACVENYAKEKGFRSFIKVGLEEMAILKGDQLLSKMKNNSECSFTLEECKYDKNWLNIKKLSEDVNKYYKFPTLFYKNIYEVFTETEKCQLLKSYQNVLGEYRYLKNVPQNNNIQAEELITDIMQIYMIFSEGDNSKIYSDNFDSWIYHLHVGRRNQKVSISCLYDDTGDTIADKNCLFAEMTGAYWIWKNIDNVDYKGLCHYRRHFIMSEEEIRALKQNSIDVILTMPRYIPYGIGNMFLAETPVKEPVFEAMHQALYECSYEDAEPFKNYMQACFYYPNNMVIAKNQIYNSYCKWIFKILFRMLEIEIKTEYGHQNDRHIAYAAELLTSFYFAKNREEYRIVITDYQFYL